MCVQPVFGGSTCSARGARLHTNLTRFDSESLHPQTQPHRWLEAVLQKSVTDAMKKRTYSLRYSKNLLVEKFASTGFMILYFIIVFQKSVTATQNHLAMFQKSVADPIKSSQNRFAIPSICVHRIFASSEFMIPFQESARTEQFIHRDLCFCVPEINDRSKTERQQNSWFRV